MPHESIPDTIRKRTGFGEAGSVYGVRNTYSCQPVKIILRYERNHKGGFDLVDVNAYTKTKTTAEHNIL